LTAFPERLWNSFWSATLPSGSPDWAKAGDENAIDRTIDATSARIRGLKIRLDRRQVTRGAFSFCIREIPFLDVAGFLQNHNETRPFGAL